MKKMIIGLLTIWVMLSISSLCSAEDLCYEYTHRNEDERAIEECTRVIERGADADSTASAYNNRGIAHYGRGQYGLAIADYTRAVELNPKYYQAYYNRGSAYYGRGQYEESELAIADYTRAIELNPKYDAAYYDRGNAYYRRGEYELAIADYTRTIELNPKYYQVYYNRGNAYYGMGQYELAIADYTRAIEFNPKDYPAYDNRGSAYYGMGKYGLAIADYTRAIELNPKDEYVYLRHVIASGRMSKEEYSRSLDALRSYVSANPSAEWIRTISKLYLSMGGVKEKEVLAKAKTGKDAKEVKERLCEAYYYMGEKRLTQGNRKGASKFFKKSVETGVYSLIEYRSSRAALVLMKDGRL